MICKHDPLYRQNNEAAGGAGCPMCNAQRTKRVVMVSTPQTTATDYNAMSESDKEMYRVFYELGGQAHVDAQVATEKRAAETNARIKAIGNERVIYGTNGTKRQRDYGMGYND